MHRCDPSSYVSKEEKRFIELKRLLHDTFAIIQPGVFHPENTHAFYSEVDEGAMKYDTFLKIHPQLYRTIRDSPCTNGAI